MIRVLIVDDKLMTRQGLQTLLELEPDLEVVGLGKNGVEAIALVGEVNPDVVLMDLKMPLMDGQESTRRIVQQYPHCRVLMLTSFEQEPQILGAFKAGAKGYLLKDGDELAQTIRSVYHGYVQMSPGVWEKVMGRMAIALPSSVDGAAGEPDMGAFEALTAREQEVLRAIGRGLSNREIAAELFLSESTVRTHISNMLNRLGLGDRVELNGYAEAIFAVDGVLKEK
jgi:DNA-binding NarL/FixJ family response regulator